MVTVTTENRQLSFQEYIKPYLYINMYRRTHCGLPPLLRHAREYAVSASQVNGRTGSSRLHNRARFLGMVMPGVASETS